MSRTRRFLMACGAVGITLGSGTAQAAGDGPRLEEAGVTITQSEIEKRLRSTKEIRRQGLLVFSTPFRKADGYGDGPIDPSDTISPGGRPTLQGNRTEGNGTFLRVNGLDGQSCLECHSIISNAVVPARFGIGGVGGAVSNAMFQPTFIDVADEDRRGLAGFDGRFINPPFLFGSGGIQQLAHEMTQALQAKKALARRRPGTDIPLTAKGVGFGSIRYEDGVFDLSRVEGIDDDLVVRPFGRKGEFATVRDFDLDALQFHFGMQPVEVVGEGVDADGDGIVDEIGVGEVSALEIFNTTLPRPFQSVKDRERERRGRRLFKRIGCADCHRPALKTRARTLSYGLPESSASFEEEPYFEVDLTEDSPGFEPARSGGVVVELFADLKRHYMGEGLAESFGSDLDGFFTTARLWGVADTAPYLHDGRATTLREAILLHGGEAEDARDDFDALTDRQQKRLLAFLESLRTPQDPTADLE